VGKKKKRGGEGVVFLKEPPQTFSRQKKKRKKKKRGGGRQLIFAFRKSLTPNLARGERKGKRKKKKKKGKRGKEKPTLRAHKKGGEAAATSSPGRFLFSAQECGKEKRKEKKKKKKGSGPILVFRSSRDIACSLAMVEDEGGGRGGGVRPSCTALFQTMGGGKGGGGFSVFLGFFYWST